MSTAGPDTLSSRGVLGYLPGHPDLVRVRGGARELRALEQWLEHGLHQAQWEQGGAFASAYSRLVYRFVFRADNSDQTVAGVLYASEDSHRRPFPFIAYELLPTKRWDQDLLSVLDHSGGFFTELEALVPALVPLGHIAQVHGRVLAGRAPLLGSTQSPDVKERLTREAVRYQNFLDETTLSDLAPDGVATVRDLAWLLRGAGRDPRSLRIGLQLPLARPVLARSLELRFYADLAQRVTSTTGATLSLFWRIGEGAPGSLFLCFREPSVDLFGALLRPEAQNRAVYVPGRGLPGPFGQPPPRSSALQPSTPLAELMRALEPPVRSVASSPFLRDWL